jgi:hypothetical protein
MSDIRSDVELDLHVIDGAQMMGAIVAEVICAQCPGLDLVALTATCAAEVFAACVDMRVLAEVESEQARAQVRARRAA